MFPGCLQDFSRMFSGCSDGSYWPCGIWWSFQMKVWTLRSKGIRWSPGIWWSPAIRWSIRSMDFHNRKVYGDHTSITDGLVSTLADHFEIWRYLRLKCKVDLALRLGTTNWWPWLKKHFRFKILKCFSWVALSETPIIRQYREGGLGHKRQLRDILIAFRILQLDSIGDV